MKSLFPHIISNHFCYFAFCFIPAIRCPPGTIIFIIPPYNNDVIIIITICKFLCLPFQLKLNSTLFAIKCFTDPGMKHLISPYKYIVAMKMFSRLSITVFSAECCQCAHARADVSFDSIILFPFYCVCSFP